MRLIRKIKEEILQVIKNMRSLIFNNKECKYLYLKSSIFLAGLGLKPLFSPSGGSSSSRWSRQGTEGSSDDPRTYLKEDRSLETLFKDVVEYLPKDSAILEIGCNAGRSLNYLHHLGYKNLTGIEIGAQAVKLMQEAFPLVYKSAKVIVGDAAQEIKSLPSEGYDLVFCHSVLVNIPPKDNNIFKEMARVSRKFVLILENEGSLTAYPRDFQKMFERQGLKMVMTKVLTARCESIPVPFECEHLYQNNTIRIFVKDMAR